MRYAAPARLGSVVLEGSESDELVVFLMPLPDGPPVALKASAALIWLIAADGAVDVADAVAEHTDRRADEIRDAVQAHLGDLVGRGLLLASP